MKKLLCVALALFMVTGLFAGLAMAEEGITLYVTDWEDDQMNAAIQKACDEIFTARTGVKVVILPNSYDDYGQGVTSMIDNKKVDIFQQGYDQGKTRFDQGTLLDLTDYIAAEPEFAEGFYPGAMDGWKSNDHVYGLPGLANVYGAFYNKTWLEENGLEVPTTDWTWDDLWALATKIHEITGEYGLYNFGTDIFSVTQISVSEGGQPFMDKPVDPTGVSVDEKLAEAVAKISELDIAGILPSRTYEGDGLQSQYEAGKIPLFWYGQWEINQLVQKADKIPFEWGYAPSPKGSVTGATLYDYTGWCARGTTEHPAEVWELLKFLASEGYGEVLNVTPVAACAHESTAAVFFDTVVAAGHPEAADAVKNMMERDQKVAIRFGGGWADDASKTWDITYNDLVDKGSSDFLGTLQKAADAVNMMILYQ